MKARHVIIIGLAALFVAQAMYYYPLLPDLMASHFDGSGTPDGWMTKSGYFAFGSVLLLVILFEFFALPRLLEKIPDSLVNLPKKEYWLAPERRAEAFGILRSYLEWFAVVILALFICVNQMVYRANLARENLDDRMWLVIIAFLVVVAVWLFKLISRFRKTE